MSTSYLDDPQGVRKIIQCDETFANAFSSPLSIVFIVFFCNILSHPVDQNAFSNIVPDIMSYFYSPPILSPQAILRLLPGTPPAKLGAYTYL